MARKPGVPHQPHTGIAAMRHGPTTGLALATRLHGPNAALKFAAHHGTAAHTPHGPGGMKAKGMKIPKVPRVKSGLKMQKPKNGGVKIPSTMHAPRPGKGMHNHSGINAMRHGPKTGLALHTRLHGNKKVI
jgi:hypothetical protein